MVEGERLIEVELTREERTMLVIGLTDWGGPVLATESLAVAVGFRSLDQMELETARIAAGIGSRDALDVRDWTRALTLTEVAFATEGDEWTTNQGGHDAEWINVLRQLQRKVPKDQRFLGP